MLNRELFEAKIDRTGEHHLWTGAIDQSGTGQFKVDGRIRSPAAIAWELAHGAVPEGHRAQSCPERRLCIRPEHLQLRKYGKKKTNDTNTIETETGETKHPGRPIGSMREVAPGKWKLTIDADRDTQGHRRRVTRTMRGTNNDATRALAVLVTEVQTGQRRPTANPALPGQSFVVDNLIDWYITFARDVRGLERTTVFGYAEVYRARLKDRIGHIDAERLTPADIDNAFGNMRRAGLSHSRMNNARAALSGAYKWGHRHGKVNANPTRGFELPKSMKVPKRTTAPEIDELLTLLAEASRTDPEFSPVLTLAATTGMRRGELSGLRRNRLKLDRNELRVERSISEIDGEIEDKPTKTHDTRIVRLDQATVDFLRDHLTAMDQRAQRNGVTVADDGFVFSREPNCARPMRPELMTRRMRRLRKQLGAGSLDFDATILAMRKWTSTELMDAGFNPATVSGRQGHTIQVMLTNYSSRRASADQAAADHLGAVVHQSLSGPD